MVVGVWRGGGGVAGCQLPFFRFFLTYPLITTSENYHFSYSMPTHLLLVQPLNFAVFVTPPSPPPPKNNVLNKKTIALIPPDDGLLHFFVTAVFTILPNLMHQQLLPITNGSIDNDGTISAKEYSKLYQYISLVLLIIWKVWHMNRKDTDEDDEE